MLDARLRPFPLGRVDLAFSADTPDRIVHEVTVLAVHEVDVAGVAGPYDGLTERHGLRHRETEPLRTVQRHVTVACGHQTVHLGPCQGPVDDMDVGAAVRRPQDLLLGEGAQRGIDRLDQQLRSLAGRERALERLDQPDGVLALHRAQVVEHEQEQEAAGDPETQRPGGLCWPFDRGWQRDDRHRGDGADVLGHETRVHPDLVHERERPRPAQRNRVRLPSPYSDPGSCEVAVAEAFHEVRELVGVHRDDLKAVRAVVHEILETV